MEKVETQKDYKFGKYRVQVNQYHEKDLKSDVTIFDEDQEIAFSGTLEFLETLSAINEELK